MVKRSVLLLSSLVLLFCLKTSAQNSREKDVSQVISPDAVKLDVDDFKFITHEVVVVVKERKEALVDLKGNFLIPWGKYTYDRNSPQTWGGLMEVQDPTNRKVGFIDFRGNVVIPLTEELSTFSGFNHFGLCNVSTYNPRTPYVIDNKGNRLPHNDVAYGAGSPEYLREVYNKKQYTNRILIGQSELGKSFRRESTSIGSISKHSYGDQINKIGYGNKYGKILLPADYDVIREFTDERAAVMKRDEFGVEKWGFIDTLGKLVIPFTFRNEPGYFHDGLALVEPTDKTDFQYAYIDKNGNVKIKLGGNQNKGYYEPVNKSMYVDYPLTQKGYFINSYSIWRKDGEQVLLDTLGKIHTIDEFISQSGTPSGSAPNIVSYDEIGIHYSLKIATYTFHTEGLINYQRNSLFPPFFKGIIPDYYSSFAIARFSTGYKPIEKYGQWLEGIINKEGKFIMIREKKEIF